MRTPMPSPNGTNHALLFVNTPGAAYDAAPVIDGNRKLGGLSGKGYTRLMEFLTGKLEDDDMFELHRLLEGIGGDKPTDLEDDPANVKNVEQMENLAGDEPPNFRGKPKVGGGMVAQDQKSSSDGSFYSRFPSAKLIGHV
jgi:hypothetical protein